jgi:fimbrial chaperone protein
MNHLLKAAILLVAGVACTLPAGAAQFTITPVRIFMTPRDRAVAVTVTNDSDEEVVMQADLFTWKQRPDGSDDLQPTEDLILTPPILKLAPRARQVVRLARLSAAPVDEQQTYRLVVRELPEARANPQQLQLQVALAFSLPVFISPPGARRDLSCSASRSSPTALLATCENRGTAYAQAATLTLSTPSGNTLASTEVKGGYILPGVKRSFEINGEGSRVPGGALKLQVTQDDGSKQVFDVTVPE